MPLGGVQSSARPTRSARTRTTSEEKAAGSSSGGGGCFDRVFSDSPPKFNPLLFQLKIPQYDAKLCKLLDTYDKAFLVHADNVGSRQFMDIRRVRSIYLFFRRRSHVFLARTLLSLS